MRFPPVEKASLSVHDSMNGLDHSLILSVLKRKFWVQENWEKVQVILKLLICVT